MAATTAVSLQPLAAPSTSLLNSKQKNDTAERLEHVVNTALQNYYESLLAAGTTPASAPIAANGQPLSIGEVDYNVKLALRNTVLYRTYFILQNQLIGPQLGSDKPPFVYQPTEWGVASFTECPKFLAPTMCPIAHLRDDAIDLRRTTLLPKMQIEMSLNWNTETTQQQVSPTTTWGDILIHLDNINKKLGTLKPVESAWKIPVRSMACFLPATSEKDGTLEAPFAPVFRRGVEGEQRALIVGTPEGAPFTGYMEWYAGTNAPQFATKKYMVDFLFISSKRDEGTNSTAWKATKREIPKEVISENLSCGTVKERAIQLNSLKGQVLPWEFDTNTMITIHEYDDGRSPFLYVSTPMFVLSTRYLQAPPVKTWAKGQLKLTPMSIGDVKSRGNPTNYTTVSAGSTTTIDRINKTLPSEYRISLESVEMTILYPIIISGGMTSETIANEFQMVRIFADRMTEQLLPQGTAWTMKSKLMK